MHEFHFLEQHKDTGSEVKYYKNRVHITESRAIFAAPIGSWWFEGQGAHLNLPVVFCR